MKNSLFLFFLGMSTFSFGQTQETTIQKSIEPQVVQQQQVSKINKIDKRITPIRKKESEVPVKKEESIKQN